MATSRYRFAVTGKGPFPLDMCRYDACFPDSQEVKPPTEGRWESFQWKVSEVSKY